MIALALLLAAGTPELIVAPPGCFDGSWTRMRLGQALEAAAAAAGGTARPQDITLSALSRDGAMIIARPPYGDDDVLDRFALATRDGPPTRRPLGVIEARDTPWETAWSLPDDKGAAMRLLQEQGSKRSLEVTELTAGGETVILLAPPGHELQLPVEPLQWWRGPLVVDEVQLGGQPGRVFRLGKRSGARGRLLHELGRWHQPGDALLLAGDLRALRGPDRARCLEDLDRLKPQAIGVGGAALALSAAELDELALPFVSANVVAADGSRVFDRFRLVRAGGRTVAVIAVTERAALEELAPGQRGRWRLEPPRAAVEAALIEIDRLGEPVDAIVGLGHPTSLVDDGQSGARRGLDVVIGDHVLADLSARTERVLVDARTRAEAVPPPPILTARPSSVGITRVRFRFAGESIAEVEMQTHPVAQDGPRIPFDGVALDPPFQGIFRGGAVLVPDLDEVLRADPGLSSLTFGERVLHRFRRHQLSADHPARVTDPVWMRLVTNAMRDDAEAEVALARNLARAVDVTGPLTRGAVRSWLPEDEIVDVRFVTGRALVSLAEIIRKTSDDPRTPSHDLLFVSGLDPAGPIVGGRPVDPDAPYRIALTRAAAALPDVGRALGPPSSGPGRPLRALVLARLERTVPDARAKGAAQALLPLLRDPSHERSSFWQLRVDELGGTGTFIQAVPGLEQYARSRETRATTPDLVNIGLRVTVGALYDGALLGWENRLQVRYSSLILLIDGVPPREQEDEVLATTEVRLHQLAHSLVGRWATLKPYAQLAFDSELTATPDVLNPGVSLPHQLLLRQAVGFAVVPATGWVTEVRGGIVLQEDGSELTEGPLEVGDVHLDVGFTVGLTTFVPVGPLSYRSATDARLFVPDPDDRPTDLGVRLSSHHRVEAQVFGRFQAFVFADGLLLTSKSFSTLPSGSLLFGVGLQFRSIFKL